jgi:beta-phosphoglucomutase
MRLINDYQLFLFDFDGLLVNTEEIHYQAYQRMLQRRGFDLGWDFPYYCSVAHYSSEGLREQIYAKFPALEAAEPSWDVLYAEKKQAFIELIHEGAVHLMAGVEQMLKALEAANVKRCVVTHSAEDLVSYIRKQNPVLDTIPHWITRWDYSHPKPNPECYLKAIERLAKATDKVVGFEDTPRGLQALQGTRATPILVSAINYPELPSYISQGIKHYTSFVDLL